MYLPFVRVNFWRLILFLWLCCISLFLHVPLTLCLDLCIWKNVNSPSLHKLLCIKKNFYQSAQLEILDLVGGGGEGLSKFSLDVLSLYLCVQIPNSRFTGFSFFPGVHNVVPSCVSLWYYTFSEVATSGSAFFVLTSRIIALNQWNRNQSLGQHLEHVLQPSLLREKLGVGDFLPLILCWVVGRNFGECVCANPKHLFSMAPNLPPFLIESGKIKICPSVWPMKSLNIGHIFQSFPP